MFILVVTMWHSDENTKYHTAYGPFETQAAAEAYVDKKKFTDDERFFSYGVLAINEPK